MEIFFYFILFHYIYDKEHESYCNTFFPFNAIIKFKIKIISGILKLLKIDFC